MTGESVAEIKFIPATAIVSRVEARSVKADGVDRLRGKIERLGFQTDKPLRVYAVDGGYRLIDGNHRLEAAIKLSLATIPALIVDPPADGAGIWRKARIRKAMPITRRNSSRTQFGIGRLMFCGI